MELNEKFSMNLPKYHWKTYGIPYEIYIYIDVRMRAYAVCVCK